MRNTNKKTNKGVEMKLITKAISNKMPKLYSTDGQGDKAIVQAKLFGLTNLI